MYTGKGPPQGYSIERGKAGAPVDDDDTTGAPYCQYCTKKGHWTFDCQAKKAPAYKKRPSATQLLKDKLKQQQQAAKEGKVQATPGGAVDRPPMSRAEEEDAVFAQFRDELKQQLVSEKKMELEERERRRVMYGSSMGAELRREGNEDEMHRDDGPRREHHEYGDHSAGGRKRSRETEGKGHRDRADEDPSPGGGTNKDAELPILQPQDCEVDEEGNPIVDSSDEEAS